MTNIVFFVALHTPRLPRPVVMRRSATPAGQRWPIIAAIGFAAVLARPDGHAEGATGRGMAAIEPPLLVAAGAAPEGAKAAASPASAPDADCAPLLRHTLNRLQTGKAQSLCEYSGKVVLIVNTASYCGYTNQYDGLEALHRKYRDRGLVVLGFPSNDYGAQEPGSNKEIAEFCRTTYGIDFPMFEKTAGTRLAAHPLYAELVAKTGQAPQWNFHKYLVDRSGRRVESFGSAVEPGQRAFVSAIERLLAEKPTTLSPRRAAPRSGGFPVAAANIESMHDPLAYAEITGTGALPGRPGAVTTTPKGH